VRGEHIGYLHGVGQIPPDSQDLFSTFIKMHVYSDYVCSADMGKGQISILYLDKISNKNRVLEDDIKNIVTDSFKADWDKILTAKSPR
jgi:hypothetical protein